MKIVQNNNDNNNINNINNINNNQNNNNENNQLISNTIKNNIDIELKSIVEKAKKEMNSNLLASRKREAPHLIPSPIILCN